MDTGFTATAKKRLCFVLLGDRGPRAPASLCGGVRCRRRHRPPPKWSEAPRSADGPEGSLPHPPAARAPATSPRGQAPCGTASSVRLLLSAPSPSFPPGVWRDTNPQPHEGAGTASQGAGLWLQTLNSQVTNNTMSPGNEFRFQQRGLGRGRGRWPLSWAMRVGLSGDPGGSSAPRQAARMCSLTSVIEPLISQTSALGPRRRKMQLLSGTPTQGAETML